MINSRSIPGAAAVIFLTFLSCMELAGGTGGETTNGRVAGMVIFPDSRPASNVRIRLLPAQYDPVKDSFPVRVDTTDDEGRYLIAEVDSGEYTLQATYDKDRTMAMEAGIVVADEAVDVEALSLSPPGTITIILQPDVNVMPDYVYIPGTMLVACPDSATGYVTLDPVPAGIIPVISYSSVNSTASGVVTENVPVPAGDTVTIACPDRACSRRLVLNTSGSGADVPGDVHDFPVLIRLNDGNFDFTQARDDGGDLLFTGADHRTLPFEIERWDPEAGRAEVWVKVAAVFGNDSTQYISMYWGNPDALSESNGAGVFDTGSHFQAVWHCGENGDSLYDATGNHFSAGRNGNQALVEGAIGYAQSYVDSGDFSDMGSVLNPLASGFTVSAWIRRADTGGIYTIIGKTNGDTILSADYGWLLALNADYLRVYVASGAEGSLWGDEGTYWSESSVKITDLENWHHVGVTVDKSLNAGCRLFIDGTDVTGSRNGDIAGVGTLTNTLPLRIGCEADDDYPNRGYIDEATVSFTTRSPDWIRLCYMNQRRDDRLVVFK